MTISRKIRSVFLRPIRAFRPGRSFFCLIGLFVLGALVAGCMRNLVTQKRQVRLISEAAEIRLGKEVYDELVKDYGVFSDPAWQVYVSSVGTSIAQVSDRSQLQYTFTILDSDIVNAFASPGGYVFITRGLLTVAADEAELAAVLSHEIGHVAAQHGVQMIQKQYGIQFLTTLGAIGAGIASGNAEALLTLAKATEVISVRYLMGYSREFEFQADETGFTYTLRAGYDPEAITTFLDRLRVLEKQEDVGARIVPYYRSHPPTGERVAQAREFLSGISLRGEPLNYFAERYQLMLKRLPTQEAVQRGKISGQRYTNEFYKVALEVPKGWVLDNSRYRSLVGFVSEDGLARGEVRRFGLPPNVTAKDFAEKLAHEWGILPSDEMSKNKKDKEKEKKDAGKKAEPEPLQKPKKTPYKEVTYPAGLGLLWQYGDYIRYRSLFVVRGQEGFVITCQATDDNYLQNLVAFEQIMRSFTFTP